MEKKGAITFKGNPMTLVGDEVKTGDQAPEFAAVGNDMRAVTLGEFKGTPLIISSVPSLDTPVCELQTKRFNEEAGKLDAKILTISMDLPFAQKRFCGANGVQNLQVISDYKDREFGKAYVLYIKELGLLARSVLVLDRAGRIVYWEIVKEVSEQPNYERALEEAKKVAAV